jgi:hypothetical protein
VGRDRGLRQAAALVDLAGADTVFGAVVLVRELHVGVFQPVENFSPYWMGQGFYYFVEIERHGWAHGCVVVYRDVAKYKSIFRDIQI